MDRRVDACDDGYPSRPSASHPSHVNSNSFRDADDSTVVRVKITVWVSMILVALVWTAGFFVIVTGKAHLVLPVRLGEAATEMILLVFTLVVTFCTDALGYAHATSLRWALHRNHRLEFNTNFRLFTNAKGSIINGGIVNALLTVSLVLCYASVSALLLRGSYSDDYDLAVNGMALVLLGAGLVPQAAVGAACVRQHRITIPSWSANPLLNARRLQNYGLIQRCAGRCMQSFFDQHQPPAPTRPRKAQLSLWNMRCGKWILASLWTLCVGSFIWAGIIIYIPNLMFNTNRFRFEWDSDSGDTYRNVIFGMDPHTNDPQINIKFPVAVQFFLGILFLCFIQGIQTLGLHCVELVVNMSRDEEAWRAGTSSGGMSPETEPLVAAVTSWRTLFLMLLKALHHWLLGQSMVLHYHVEAGDDWGGSEFTFNMSSSRLLVFAVLTAVTALFTTVMIFWRPRGPQPATWGHFQTLCNLVDEWNSPGGRLWWGEKGGNGENKHAGTSGDRLLKPPNPEALYAG